MSCPFVFIREPKNNERRPDSAQVQGLDAGCDARLFCFELQK